MKNNSNNSVGKQDGIILLAKQPFYTSFSSLNIIKKALKTSKVGHTGTLDSFAQGLLVVCTGRLTKLAGNITEFDKTYEAVIKFGSETDTLEYTGQVIKTTDLPTEEELISVLKRYNGQMEQIPPSFSAIHINGKRASDLVRSGHNVEIPKRQINIFYNKLIAVQKNAENKVEYAHIEFSVSKGTYIRSLARDIGADCSSSAHLIGLFRTKVGNFKIEDSVGKKYLNEFNIKNSIENVNLYFNSDKDSLPKISESIKDEILENINSFTEDVSNQCGFVNLHLVNEQKEDDFLHGRYLKASHFADKIEFIKQNENCAVFSSAGESVGLIEKDAQNKFKYKFVIN